MTESHPVITAHINGTTKNLLDELVARLVSLHPVLSPNRAKEIAGAYLMRDLNLEMETITDDEIIDLDDMDDTPRATIIDVSGNRGIMYDLDDLVSGRLDYTL